MRAVLDNAKELTSAAQLLYDAQRHRASELLLSVAAEESAKYLILMDSVRCAKPRRAQHLQCFNNHIAKGIYARYAASKPAPFGEVCDFIIQERQSHYLDGPTGYDWIFRNSILQQREELFYVDYVKDDKGRCSWCLPGYSSPFFGIQSPKALDCAETLARAGMDRPEALSIISAVWMDVTFEASDPWDRCLQLNRQTLAKLKDAELLTAEGQKEYDHIAWETLPFPLGQLEPVKEIKVCLDDLRVKRDGAEPW